MLRRSLSPLLRTVADTADCIFVANVLAVNEIFRNRVTRAATSVRLHVSDVIKSGPFVETAEFSKKLDTGIESNVVGHLTPGEIVVVSVPGGFDPDADLRLTVPGAPQFVVGERVLLFVRHRTIENMSLPLSGQEGGTTRHFVVSHFALGAFKEYQVAGTAEQRVRGSNQRTFAVNPSADPASITEHKVRDFSTFIEYLRSRVGGFAAQKRSSPIGDANYWVSKLSIHDTEPIVLAPREKRYALFDKEPRWCDFETTATNWRHTEGGQPSNSPTAVYANGALPELAQAMDLFNNFTAAKVAYVLAGTTTSTKGFVSSDGINGIIYNDPNSEITSGPFNCSSGGVLAIGGSWTSSDSCIFMSRTHARIVESELIMNAGIGCSWITLTSLAEIYAHEFGHTLGFAHSTVANALMYPTLHNDGRGAAMDVDDEHALVYLYEATNTCTATASGLVTNGACGGTAWTFGTSLASVILGRNSVSDCLQVQDLSNVVCDIPTGSKINRIDVSVTLTASSNGWTLTKLGLIGLAGRYPSAAIAGSIGTTATRIVLSGNDAFWLPNEPAGSLSDSSKFVYGSGFGFWFEVSTGGGPPSSATCTFSALSATIDYSPPSLTTGTTGTTATTGTTGSTGTTGTIGITGTTSGMATTTTGTTGVAAVTSTTTTGIKSVAGATSATAMDTTGAVAVAGSTTGVGSGSLTTSASSVSGSSGSSITSNSNPPLTLSTSTGTAPLTTIAQTDLVSASAGSVYDCLLLYTLVAVAGCC